MLLLWLLVFILCFQHFFYFVSILFLFYDDSLTVEFIPHTQAWLLCHTLMRLILQPLMSFWWHSMFFFLVEYCNVICFYNLVICWIEKWNLENIMKWILSWMALLRKSDQTTIVKANKDLTGTSCKYSIRIFSYQYLVLLGALQIYLYRNETTSTTQILSHHLNISCLSMASSFRLLIFLFSQGINPWGFLPHMK